jgi:Na+-transporting NADH:ubiquinone oxidoreductase subunit C
MQLRPLLAVVAALPASATAADYLSVAQAQATIFPDAERFEPRDVLLDDALRARLGAAASSALAGGHLAYSVARRGDLVLGAVAVDEVIGKFERITYAVGVDARGAVKQVEILSYRESHGGEVRLPAWRKQFVGKDAGSALTVGDDIAGVSGATLSCNHVTAGVKRLVTVFDALIDAGKLS